MSDIIKVKKDPQEMDKDELLISAIKEIQKKLKQNNIDIIYDLQKYECKED